MLLDVRDAQDLHNNDLNDPDATEHLQLQRDVGMVLYPNLDVTPKDPDARQHKGMDDTHNYHPLALVHMQF